MIKTQWELSIEDEKKLRQYLSQSFREVELSRIQEEIEDYYEGKLPPYIISESTDEIMGILFIQEIDDTTAFARIFTNSNIFLLEVKEVLLEYGIIEVIFESSTRLNQVENLKFEDAEYKMSLSYDKTLELLNRNTELIKADELSFVSATKEDKALYTHLLEVEFDMDAEEASDRYEMLLNETKMFPMLVKRNDQTIGISAYLVGESFITLFDLVIMKQYRGKGQGTKMFLSLLNQIHSPNKKFLLQVTHSNQIALHLYEKAGFEVEEQLITYEWHIG